MPVVEGQVFLQAALVAGLIGLIGLVLRWTLRRDPGTRPRQRWRRRTPGSAPEHSEATQPISPPSGPSQPEAAASTSPGAPSGTSSAASTPERGADGSGAATSGRRGEPAKDSVGSEASPAQARTRPSTPNSGAGAGTAPTAPQREDYGLLAVAAEVATPEEVAAVRRALTAAGIRNTNAVSPDGKHKVLVFGHELIKARRVAGGSQGANGS